MSQSDIEVKPTLFREYIGMDDNIDDFPGDMINDDIPEFHFILGFATETYDDDDGTGTGRFKRAWNFDEFSPTKVENLKKAHTNVKVVISIGGNGGENPFDPRKIDDWVENAISSIRELIQDYENESSSDDNLIDGIDINYKYIIGSDNDFSHCIGKVIKRLKEDTRVSKSMKVISISPTELNIQRYLKLYSDNQDNIDWINYKFYDQHFDSADEFVNLFNKLVTGFGTAFKLLAGISTDTSSPSPMTQQIFVDGCTTLLKKASLAGVFVWNANTSASPYSLEADLQKLLISYIAS